MTPRQIRQTMLFVLGLTLVLVSLSYSSLLQRGYVVVKFATLLVGATALLALGTYLVAVGRRGRELRDPLIYLLFAELGVMLYSVALSGQAWVSFLGSITRVMGAVTIACFVVAGLAVVIAVGERRERLVYLLRVVAGTAALAAINAIFEWPTHHEFRAPGLVGNAEFLSNYLLFGALGAVGLVFVERRRGWAIFAIVAAALAAVGMSICKTRGAWLGYGLGVGALLLFAVPRHVPRELASRIRVRMLGLLGATFGAALLAALWGYGAANHPIEFNLLLPFLPVGGVLFFALPWFFFSLRFVRHAVLGLLVAAVLATGLSVKYQLPGLPHKVAEVLRVTQESARGVVREDTARMLRKYWLVGCGIENFRVAFLEFKSERLARFDPRVNYRNPHHMMYYEWATSGLPGVLVFLGLLGIAALWLLRARRRERDNEWGLLATALFATLSAYTLQNFFNYDVIPTGLHYYVFLGMAVVLYRTAGKRATPEVQGATATPGADAAASGDEADRAETEGESDPDAPDALGAQGTPGTPEAKTSPSAKGKKKRAKARLTYSPTSARKEVRQQTRREAKGDRKRLRELELREERLLRMSRWLAFGLLGAAALYLALHVLPGLSDLFRFYPGRETMPSRKDGLAIAVLLGWAASWAAAGLSQKQGEKRLVFLTVGLVGFALFYAAYYLVPFTRDLFQGLPEEGAPRVKEDVLPGIFLLSWSAFWLIAAFSQEELGGAADGASEGDGEGVSLGRQNTFALGLLILVFVGTGSWWAGQQLKSDHHMYRAMYFSGMANGPIGQVQQLDDRFRQLTAAMQQSRRSGADPQQSRRFEQQRLQLERQRQILGQRVLHYLTKVQHHGRIAVKSLEMLGYYHFQYSKALHPFLKAKSALPNGEAVLDESLRYAQRSVRQNTNPESAWSHLAVVYLAKRDLQKAKAALARSIQYDPYYYDTHRMMALLHLQDGHINDAEREIQRSLDITEGKHFHFSVTALQRLLAARKKGDDAAADKARAEMWYWLKRGQNFPDMPVLLFGWWTEHDIWEQLANLAGALETKNGKAFHAEWTRVHRLHGLTRFGWFERALLSALREILLGSPDQAITWLTGLARPAPPEVPPITRAIQVMQGVSRVSPLVEQVWRSGSSWDPRNQESMRRLDTWAGQIIVDPTLFFRVVALRLRDDLEAGESGRAKMAAAVLASLLRHLYQRNLRDVFSNYFREGYSQVLSARQQVMEAASEKGRMSRATMFLRTRRYSDALRVAQEAIERFGDRLAMAHYVSGAALDATGRLSEALDAYERYLKLDPQGQHAEQVRGRLAQLQAPQ